MYRNFSAIEVVLEDPRIYHRVLLLVLKIFERDFSGQVF